jgi:hypothetical protein
MSLTYIGNYSEWIKQEWLEEVLNSPGPEIPRDYRVHEEMVQKSLRGFFDKISFDEEQKDWQQMNEVYDYDGNFFFEMFDAPDLSFNLKDNRPPFLEFDGPFAWWITKLQPGKFTPMHRDSYSVNYTTYKYWMAWTDWEPGQVLMTEDEAIIKYKAGDVYKFTDPFILHGAANAGMQTRVALQITTWRPNRGVGQ